MFENPRRGRQARNFTTNVPKIVDLKSSSEQSSENLRYVPLAGRVVSLGGVYMRKLALARVSYRHDFLISNDWVISHLVI